MDRLNLQNCLIVTLEERASFVDQAIDDLVEYTNGNIVNGISPNFTGTAVLVGKEIVRAAGEFYRALADVELDGLSDQGFLLKTIRDGGSSFVVCVGGGGRGEAYAIIELIKAIDKRSDEALIDDISKREEPYFIRRGMYAHQHWAYAYPYALRTWKFEDWKRYVDMLAYMKINFFSIWSMAGILPNPLSEGDREYLENYRKVIDYAKNRRGMEVLIGECANNVAETDGGKPVQQREYFEVEILKNPSDPQQFKDIIDNRTNLYATANNADGYWIIDSDPGGYKDSPASEFVDILMGNRRLMDEHTLKGKNAKLVYWMWMSWGTKDTAGNTRDAVEDMRDRLKEPWMLLTCWPAHLDASKDLGYIDKSVFFPYGAIEDEPSPPTTRLRFNEMYEQLNSAISNYGIRNAMGNAQSPLVQLPNIFFLAETAWNGVPPSLPPDSDVVTPLARLIAPDIADDLAEGWLMLKEPNADLIFASAGKLARRVQDCKIGRIGPLGIYYFPNIERLLLDLSMQITVHGHARLLIEDLAGYAPDWKVESSLSGFYDAALKWRDVHDFHGYMCYGPDVNEITEQWKRYCEHAKPERDLLNSVWNALLSKGYEKKYVDEFLALTPIE